MSSPVSTSLTLTFASNLPAESLSLAIDSRKDGYNGGGTTFYPGDSPVLLEYRSSAVQIERRYATDGALSVLGTGSHYVEEFITVANTNVANLSKPYTGGFSVLGQWGQGVTVKSVEASSLTLTSKKIAVLKVKYLTTFTALRLSGAAGDAPVLVYVAGYVV